MKNREKKETILNGVERLILGYETLENCNNTCTGEFTREFNREILFDSLLMESAKNNPLVKNLENDEQWVELVEGVIRKNGTGFSKCNQFPWDEMINEALGKSPVIEKNRLKFPGVSPRYLIAAVILLSIVSFAFLIRKNDVRYWKEEIKTSQLIEEDTINNNQSFRKKNSIGPEIYSQNRIVALDSGTTAVVDSGAELTDIEIKDRVVSLLVVKGSVTFSVSKKRSRKFIVRTGIADIIVTGTQFRVVRIDDVLSVAVNEGSVNTVYNAGGSSMSLSNGQVALIYGDTITVIKNDSFPVFPKRKLLGTIIGSSDEELTTSRLISGAVADSLLLSLFTPGAQYLRKTELLKNFSSILQSQGRYSDALSIMKYFPNESYDAGNELNTLKMKCELLLTNGDTADAVDCLEELQKKYGDSSQRCCVLLKRYKVMKKRNLKSADSCFLRYVDCNPDIKDIGKEVIDHAHAMRNGFLFDEAIFWYEYILDRFPEGSIRNDAQYWVSDCIIQKRMSETNAFKDKGPSGW